MAAGGSGITTLTITPENRRAGLFGRPALHLRDRRRRQFHLGGGQHGQRHDLVYHSAAGRQVLGGEAVGHRGEWQPAGPDLYLTYSDGTTGSVTQSLSDWCAPQSFAGESEAVIMTYRDNNDGSRDTRPVMLYLYSFPVASGKTVISITLPKNRNVVALAATMAP